VRDVEAGGSNPLTPTSYFHAQALHRGAFLHLDNARDAKEPQIFNAVALAEPMLPLSRRLGQMSLTQRLRH
ncbi:hypothetical protein, partial [Diaphorobacter nitroreducens]|uniref:hypothetical protein n=1 Tax=Diaphorobacter nitroreducens TaxID=164759 RepID=UPI0028A10379